MTGIPNPPAYMCGPGTNALPVRKGQPRQKAQNKKTPEPIENFDFWISLHVNAEGAAEIRSSELLKEFKEPLREAFEDRVLQHQRSVMLYQATLTNPQQAVLTENAYHGKVLQRFSQTPTHGPASSTYTSAINSYQRNAKRRRVNSKSFDPQPDQTSAQFTDQALTRTHSSIDAGGAGGLTISPSKSSTQKFKHIRLDDVLALEIWFTQAFQAVQQTSCRFIAKEWVKAIHPKKQSTHPYNGKCPKDRSKESKSDPDKTKPDYWPIDVVHKEPDHIDKPNRVRLLVHLIMQTPHIQIPHPPIDLSQKASLKRSGQTPKEIYAKDLLKVLEKKKDDLQKKWDIITHIIRVRTQMEKLQDGGLDGDALTSAPNYDEDERPSGNNKRSRRKSKSQIVVNAQETPLDEDGSTPSAQSPMLSPVGSEDTPADSECYSLNQSFSSNITQDSSLSSTTQSWRPETEVRPRVQAQADVPYADAQTVHLSRNELSYSHHGHTGSRQNATPQQWPTTVNVQGLPDGVYSHGMTLPHSSSHMAEAAQFVPPPYSGTIPDNSNMMDTMIVPNGYFGPENLDLSYPQYAVHMGSNGPYRMIQDTGSEFPHEDNFMLHNGQPVYRRNIQ